MTSLPDPGDASFAEQYWFCQLDPYFTVQPLFDIWGTFLPTSVPSYAALKTTAPDGSPLFPQTYANLVDVYDPDPSDPANEADYQRFIIRYNILSITRIDRIGRRWPIVSTKVPIRSSEMRFVDIEVPLDLEFHYEIFTDFDPSTPIYTDWCSVPASAWAPNYPQTCVPVLLSDPILVARAAWVGLQSIDALTWPGRHTLFDIVSSAYPIAQSDVRGQARTNIRLLTFTLAQRAQLLRVVEAGRVLLFRIPDSSYPESYWYISVGDITEERILTDHRRLERRFTLDVAVVRRPVGDISYVGTGRTYTMLRNFEPDGYTPIDPQTYRGLRSDYLDYLGATLGIDQAAFDPAPPAPVPQVNPLAVAVNSLDNPDNASNVSTFSLGGDSVGDGDDQIYRPDVPADGDLPGVPVPRNPTADAVATAQWTEWSWDNNPSDTS